MRITSERSRRDAGSPAVPSEPAWPTGLIVAAAAVTWALGLVAAPWLAEVAAPAAGLVYAAGSLVCHQMPDRSFHLDGAQLPVCARCTGLYVGAAAGTAAWWVLAQYRRAGWPRPSALVALAAAALPTGVTAGTALVGLYDPPNAWRAALALPLGAVGGLMVGAVVSKHLK